MTMRFIKIYDTDKVQCYFVENPSDFDPRKYLSPARDAIKEMVKHKMKNVLNCSGRA